MNMHTGRNDDLRRSRTRTKVRLLPDASDESTRFRIHDNFEGFSQVDDVFAGRSMTQRSKVQKVNGSTICTESL